MSNEAPTFQIPRDVIEPIIKAHVSTAIINALGDNSRIVGDAVAAVLFTKVDSDGKSSNYTHSSSPTRIEWLVKDAITKATAEAITEQVAKHKDKIKAAVVDALSKKNSPFIKQFAEGLINAVADPDTLKWRLNVTCEQK